MTTRTLILLSTLGLLSACDREVGEQLADVPPAMSDQDGTWEDARKELSEVIDEIGDKPDPERRASIETELERKLQDVEDSLNQIADDVEQDMEESDLTIRVEELNQAANEARRDLEKVPDAVDDAWKDASHRVAMAIEDLEEKVNELREDIESDRK